MNRVYVILSFLLVLCVPVIFADDSFAKVRVILKTDLNSDGVNEYMTQEDLMIGKVALYSIKNNELISNTCQAYCPIDIKCFLEQIISLKQNNSSMFALYYMTYRIKDNIEYRAGNLISFYEFKGNKIQYIKSLYSDYNYNEAPDPIITDDKDFPLGKFDLKLNVENKNKNIMISCSDFVYLLDYELNLSKLDIDLPYEDQVLDYMESGGKFKVLLFDSRRKLKIISDDRSVWKTHDLEKHPQYDFRFGDDGSIIFTENIDGKELRGKLGVDEVKHEMKKVK